MSDTPIKTPRPIPTEMPKTPKELLAFVSWPDKYLDETDVEFDKRMNLCKTLGERYAKYMAQELNAPKQESKIWIPGMR